MLREERTKLGVWCFRFFYDDFVSLSEFGDREGTEEKGEKVNQLRLLEGLCELNIQGKHSAHAENSGVPF